tara:strand:+ start:50 stop:727 length:678 start_codon:yes stop_codon:yes gene_type:complete
MTASKYSNPTRKPVLEVKATKKQQKITASGQLGSVRLTQDYAKGKEDRSSFLFNKTKAELNVPVGQANVQLYGSKATGRNKLNTSADMMSKYGKYGIPNVEERTSNKVSSAGGKFTFPVGAAKVALFGNKTITKGNESFDFGGIQNSFKQVEKQVGANLGFKLNEKSRLGMDISREWFNGQKTNESKELDYSTEVLGGQLHITAGVIKNGQMKEKAFKLKYNINF